MKLLLRGLLRMQPMDVLLLLQWLLLLLGVLRLMGREHGWRMKRSRESRLIALIEIEDGGSVGAIAAAASVDVGRDAAVGFEIAAVAAAVCGVNLVDVVDDAGVG